MTTEAGAGVKLRRPWDARGPQGLQEAGRALPWRCGGQHGPAGPSISDLRPRNCKKTLSFVRSHQVCGLRLGQLWAANSPALRRRTTEARSIFHCEESLSGGVSGLASAEAALRSPTSGLCSARNLRSGSFPGPGSFP